MADDTRQLSGQGGRGTASSEETGALTESGKRTRDRRQQQESHPTNERAAKVNRREALGRAVTGFVDRAIALVLRSPLSCPPIFPNGNSATDDNGYCLTGPSNYGNSAPSAMMETDRINISASGPEPRTTPTTLLSEPFPESARSVFFREPTHGKSMAGASATRYSTSQTDAVGVTEQGVERAQSANDMPKSSEGGAMVPVSRKLKIRKIQVAKGGGKEGNADIWRNADGTLHGYKQYSWWGGVGEGGHVEDGDEQGDVGCGISMFAICQCGHRVLTKAMVHERWTCTGCFAWNPDMNATQCDLCFRARDFNPKHPLKTLAFRGIGSSLHGGRLALDAANITPNVDQPSRACTQAPSSTASSTAAPIVNTDMTGVGVPSTNPGAQSRCSPDATGIDVGIRRGVLHILFPPAVPGLAAPAYARVGGVGVSPVRAGPGAPVSAAAAYTRPDLKVSGGAASAVISASAVHMIVTSTYGSPSQLATYRSATDPDNYHTWLCPGSHHACASWVVATRASSSAAYSANAKPKNSTSTFEYSAGVTNDSAADTSIAPALAVGSATFVATFPNGGDAATTSRAGGNVSNMAAATKSSSGFDFTFKTKGTAAVTLRALPPGTGIATSPATTTSAAVAKIAGGFVATKSSRPVVAFGSTAATLPFHFTGLVSSSASKLGISTSSDARDASAGPPVSAATAATDKLVLTPEAHSASSIPTPAPQQGAQASSSPSPFQPVLKHVPSSYVTNQLSVAAAGTPTLFGGFTRLGAKSTGSIFGTASNADNDTTADGGGGTTRCRRHIGAPNAIDAGDGNGGPTAAAVINNPRTVQSPDITNAGCAFNGNTTTGSSNVGNTNNTHNNNAGTLAATTAPPSIPAYTGAGHGSVLTFDSLSRYAIGFSLPAQGVSFAADANTAFLAPPQGTAGPAGLLRLSMPAAFPAGTAPSVAGLQLTPPPGPAAYNFAASVAGRGGASGEKTAGGTFGAGFGDSAVPITAPQVTSGFLFGATFSTHGLAGRDHAQQPIVAVPPGNGGVFRVGGSTVEQNGRGNFRGRRIGKVRHPRPR